MAWYLDFFDMEYAKLFLDNKEGIEHQLNVVLENIEGENVQTVFEMCCGLGNLSLELAKLAYEVNANDIIPDYIAEAERRKEQLNLKNCEFDCSDIKTYPESKKYDLVLNMYSSFGYEDTKEENIEILKKAYNLLNDKGILVMELYDSEGIIKNFKDKFEHIFDNIVYKRECELTPHKDFMFQNWTVIENEKVIKQHRSKLWLVKENEMKEALQNVGFKEIKIEKENQRLILKAKK